MTNGLRPRQAHEGSATSLRVSGTPCSSDPSPTPSRSPVGRAQRPCRRAPSRARRRPAAHRRHRRRLLRGRLKIDSHNVRGLGSDLDKLEPIASSMASDHVYCTLLQETWLAGNSSYVVDGGCHLLTTGRREPPLPALTGPPRRPPVPSHGGVHGGAGILLSPRAHRDWRLSGSWVLRPTDGIIAIRLTSSSQKLFLVSAYAPAPGQRHPVAERKAHVRALEQLVATHARPNEMVVVGTDANVHLGTRGDLPPRSGHRRVLGPWGIAKGGAPGGLAKTVLDSLRRTQLVEATTYFQRSDGYYTRSDGAQVDPRLTQIDYIYVRASMLSRVTKAGRCTAARVASDHCRMRVVLRGGIHRPSHVPRLPRQRRDVDVLLDPDSEVTATFLRTLEQRLEGHDDADLAGFYEAVKGALQVVPMTTAPIDKDWFRQQRGTLQGILDDYSAAVDAEREAAHQRDADRLRRARRTAQIARKRWRAGRRRAISAWVRRNAAKVNKDGRYDLSKRHSREAWEVLRGLAEGHSSVSRSKRMRLRNPATGEPSQSAAESARIYREYLTQKHESATPYNEDAVRRLQQRPVMCHFSNVPTTDEVKEAFGRLRNGRSPGAAGVPVQAFKCMVNNSSLLRVIMRLIAKVWTSGLYAGDHVPPSPPDGWAPSPYGRQCSCDGGPADDHCQAERQPSSEPFMFREWLTAQHGQVPKKGDLSEPGNWRSVSVLDILGSVVCTVIANRIRDWAVDNLPESQNGFRRRRGTLDGVWTAHQILAQRRHAKQPTWVAAVDLVKAFDSVSREAIWAIMAKMGLPPHFIDIVRRFHSGAVLRVRCDPVTFEVRTHAGVRTGDTAGPDIFNLCMLAVIDYLMAHGNIHDIPGAGVEFKAAGDQRRPHAAAAFKIFYLGYADDALLFASTRDGLRQLLRLFIAVVEDLTGMKTHTSPTPDAESAKSVACVFPPPGLVYADMDTEPLDVGRDGRPAYIGFKDQIKYLGVEFHSDLHDGAPLQARITKATRAYNRWHRVLRSPRLTPQVKGRVLVATVLTVLLYGCEVWTATRNLRSKLESCWNRLCSAALGINRYMIATQHIRYRDVRNRLQVLSAQEYFRRRVMIWAGNVARMPLTRWPRRLLLGQPSGLVSQPQRSVAQSTSSSAPALAPAPAPAPADVLRLNVPQLWAPSRLQRVPHALSVEISPSNRARCQVTVQRIPRGQVRFVRAGQLPSYYSTRGVALLVADDAQWRNQLREHLDYSISRLPTAQAEQANSALSERMARSIARARNPAIFLPNSAPWTCNRCGRTFQTLNPASAHARAAECSVPRMPPPGRRERAALRASRASAARAGAARKKHWRHTLRWCLKSKASFTTPTLGCSQCQRKNASCDPCFQARWMRAAHDDSWLKLTYKNKLDRPAQR